VRYGAAEVRDGATAAHSTAARRAAAALAAGLPLAAVAHAAALLFAAADASAQPALPRPGDVRPELPAFERPEEEELELPPLAPPSEPGRLSEGPRIVVRAFRITGSTVFSEAELEAVAAPFLNRQVSSGDLQELRDRLTRLYIDAGYLNSGAVLPDQTVRDGVVEYRIVEGRLSAVEVEGQRRFRPDYLERRLWRGAGVPLSVRELERELQILQQDRRIRRVQAELRPGDRPGEAVLRARFEERRPWHVTLEASNHEPPDVGAYRGRLRLEHLNLTGRGDVLAGQASLTQGFGEYELDYEIPLNRYDTAVGVRYLFSQSDVIEEPFDDLDIESRSHTASLFVRQPVYRSERLRGEVSVFGEWRRSQTYLLNEPFSFTAGPKEGESTISVLRFASDWTWRDLSQVLALRSTWSVGIHALGATRQRGDVPDGQFLAWLGQVQWARRFDRLWGVQTLVRADVQLADSPLLSLEQFAVGGHASVRGYRENELVRDAGFVASAELRIPLWSAPRWGATVQLAPFADFGSSWNPDRQELEPRKIGSVGVGLRATLSQYLFGEIYWGHPLRDVDEPEDHDLQDDGVHFAVTLAY
jgi:hemolysin activation/secretion protein